MAAASDDGSNVSAPLLFFFLRSGSINVDMYVRTHAAVDDDGTPQAILYFAGGVPVDVTAVKG